jgi:hypothetical protein
MAYPIDFRFPVPPRVPPAHSGTDGRADGPLPVLDMQSRDALPNLPTGRAMSLLLDHDVAAMTWEEDFGVPPDVAGMFWLNGDVLMCSCPDCGAPMTVRLWLMLADCWQCEACIELTAAQQHEARRVLERHQPPHVVTAASGAAVAAAVGASDAVSTALDDPRLRPAIRRLPDARQPHIAHEPLAPPRSEVPRRVSPRPGIGQSDTLSQWLNAFVKNMPAWLISLLFHVLLLTVLGLLTQPREKGPYITLSMRVNQSVREGGHTRFADSTDESVFDLGVPEGIDVSDPAQRRAMMRADQDARELRLIDPENPHVPDLTRIKQQITDSSSAAPTLAVRDPRMRVEMVQREGGTTLTEAAVARGLRWLARHQNTDGSWSLDRFHRVEGCNCGDRGSLESESAGTSLALLPFLGAGQTHLAGIYEAEVAKGLRWLLRSQGENGDLRGGSGQYPGMYAQGQGAIVLCEAFLMTGDEALRVPAQKAIDYIVAAQYPDGGWRYYPRSETHNLQGDTSVVGWQLMALQSALAAGLSVPEATMENAGHFLDTVQHDDGAQYSYLPREQASAPMTAEAQLCRIYLGWKRNHPPLAASIRWMLTREPPSPDRPNIYYWYYATQTFHHFGGPEWNAWNLQMRDVLVATQETSGHVAGSWSVAGPLTSQGGRVYMTSLAICCLEVYYRHLPIFRQIDLEQ